MEMEIKIDRYAEMLPAVLPAKRKKELLCYACKPVDPDGCPQEIPAELVAAMTGTPLEFLLEPENGRLFGAVMGQILLWIREEEKK